MAVESGAGVDAEHPAKPNRHNAETNPTANRVFVVDFLIS